MHKPAVGVLRGGPSSEYEVSLKTGANVLGALRRQLEDRYRAHDILIDRDGAWHLDGIGHEPEQIIHKVDVVFNALHGTFGEDGKVQTFFEIHHLPFTGSKSLASAVGMNKIMAKNVFTNHGIKTPYWKEISSESVNKDVSGIVHELFHSFLLPAVVKPAASGSSVGVSLVKSYKDLPEALLLASKHGDTVLLEEFIPGIEATCGVVEGFRDQELYALPPIEIRSHTGLFDYEAKYGGKSQEIVPASFSDKIKRALEDLAQSVHRLLGLRHYSRSDFIIHPRRGIYVLEANTLPGLTDESLFPKSLRAVGSDTHEFVDHVIQLAMGRR